LAIRYLYMALWAMRIPEIGDTPVAQAERAEAAWDGIT